MGGKRTGSALKQRNPIRKKQKKTLKLFPDLGGEKKPKKVGGLGSRNNWGEEEVRTTEVNTGGGRGRIVAAGYSSREELESAGGVSQPSSRG